MSALAPPLGGPGSEKEKVLYINTPTHPPQKKLIGKTFSGRFRAEFFFNKILKVFCRDPLPSSSLCPEAAAGAATAPQGCRSGPLSCPSPPETWRSWVQFPLPFFPPKPSPPNWAPAHGMLFRLHPCAQKACPCAQPAVFLLTNLCSPPSPEASVV